MNRLINALGLGLFSVGNSTKTCTGKQSDTTGDNGGLIRKYIALKIRGKYNAIQLRRTLNQDHGRTVNKLVLDL